MWPIDLIIKRYIIKSAFRPFTDFDIPISSSLNIEPISATLPAVLVTGVFSRSIAVLSILAGDNSIGDLGGISRSSGVSILVVPGNSLLVTAPGEGNGGGAAIQCKAM